MAKMSVELGISGTRDDELCNDLAKQIACGVRPSDIVVNICERSDVTILERAYLVYLLGGYTSMCSMWRR